MKKKKVGITYRTKTTGNNAKTCQKDNWLWKKNVTITKNELKPHQDAKECYIYRIRFIKEYAKNENHQKVRDHCHDSGTFRGAAHSICSLNFNVPEEIPVVFHNGSNYDYHFIIKKLAK